MKKDDMLEITIEDISSDGSGVGKADGFALFVKDTIPGDQVKVKIMKMKKLLAVVLTGVMALSMLTGCASIASRQAADELEGMLHSVKGMSKASVTADDDTLAKDALKDIKGTDGKLKANSADLIKANLAVEKNNGKYVWYTTIAAKDAKKVDKAAKIFNAMTKNGTDEKELDTSKAANSAKVTVNGKKGDEIEPTDNFKLSVKEFTVKEDVSGKTTDVDYIMIVVTCKAQVKAVG